MHARNLPLMIAGRLVAGLAAIWLSACAPEGLSVDVSQAVYRPPLGTSDIGVAYFSIRSTQPDAITSVGSPAARSIEMHATISEGGMSRMVRIERVELPAGETVGFSPGGMHLMVFAPAQIEAGATFPITIGLESGVKLDVPFSLSAAGP